MKKISIIIPCYNVGKYLPKTIDSLRKQSKLIPSEFIFVNDGSTDDTLQLIRNFEKEDNRVCVIDKSNGGVSEARNDALKIARGEYVYLVDGDDYITPDALEIIQNSLSTSQSDLLITNFFLTYTDRVMPCYHGILPYEYNVDQLFKICRLFPLSHKNVYKNSIIKKYNIKFDKKIKAGEVYEFTVSYLRRANSIKVINDSIYYYVMHESNTIHKPNLIADISALNVLENLYADDSFSTYISYHLTAFKLVTSFTYNKYLKYGSNINEALIVINALKSNFLYNRVLYFVVTKKHSLIKERILAMYILLTSITGFRLLVNLRNIFKWKI